MKYYLCVDEKGQFEHDLFKKEKSTVGGFFCNESSYYKIEHTFENFLKEFNKKVTQYKPHIPKLTKSELHFRILHCGKDPFKEGFTYPKDKGQQFIKEILSKVKNNLLMICHTSGKSPLYLHPQHNYVIALISLIAGVITNQKEILKGSNELIIKIATRNKIVLSGHAQEDKEKYQSILKKEIEETLRRALLPAELEIKLEFLQAKDNYHLILADFLLGAMYDSIYAEEISPLPKKIFDINQFYHISLGNKPERILSDLQKNSNIKEAALLALDFYNNKEEKYQESAKSFLYNILPEFLQRKDFSLEFASLLDLFLSEINAQRHASPTSLEDLKRTSSILLEIEKEKNLSLPPSIKERCLYYLVHYEAHSGVSADPQNSYSQQYENFFKDNGHLIYPSLPERVSKRLETKLIALQSLYFNNFLFEDIIKDFEPEINLYEQTFKILHQREKTDSLYARLCGTYAQALAFCGSINNNKKLIYDAIDYFSIDLQYLEEDSQFKHQCLSFLLSCYWMLEDIENYKKIFRDMVEDFDNIDELLHKIEKARLSENEKIFRLLDFMRYAELAERLDFDNLSAKSKKTLLGLTEKYSNKAIYYPYNLFIKWNALLQFRYGCTEKAMQLLQLIDKPIDNSIFYQMTAAIAKMMMRTIEQNNQRDEEISNTIKILRSQYPGFKRFAEAKNLSDDVKQNNHTIEEIVRLMPYYYS